MSRVNNTSSVTLKEFAGLVYTCGRDVTFIGQGEPGIGKSAILKSLAKEMPTHDPVYLDAALFDVGDMQMPDVREGAFSFLPNSLFVSVNGRPKLIMIDEFGKGGTAAQNAMLSLVHERRVGNYWLPEDSIVFATTNLGSDGLGDAVPAHARNRVTVVNIKKPSAGEWINWACVNDVDPALQAWVNEFPHCMASYTDEGVADNQYIFNPKKQQMAFVTPRSLERASNILKNRVHLTSNSLLTSLCGTIGESAAHDLQVYIDTADKNPPWETIMKKPETTDVPKDTISQVIMALGAATRITKKEVQSWLTYLARMEPETKVIFFKQVLSNTEKSSWFATRAKSASAVDMISEINWMITGEK